MKKKKRIFQPRRFLVEMDFDEDLQIYIPRLVEETGKHALVYIVEVESPWVGAPLEEIEKWAKEKEYGEYTDRLFKEIERAKNGETFFDNKENQ